MKFIIKKMRRKKDRSAFFVCSLSYSHSKKLVTAVGIIKGSISFEILGSKGFGYDPIFIPESEKITFGQCKNLKK